MIKGILFVVFIIALLAAIGLTVFLGVKYFKSKADSDYSDVLAEIRDKYESKMRWENSETRAKLKEECKREQEKYLDEHPHSKPKGKAGFITGIVTSLAFLGLVVCIPGSFHQVETGTVAVVRHLGNIVGVREPGTYFDFYMTNAYEVYDTKVQQDKIVTAAYSKDGQTMDLEVFLQYRVQTNHIREIATQYGNLDALQSRIETQTIEKTKAVMSSAEAMTIIQNRAQFSADVSTAVREGISEDYYVDIKDVVLTNIDFTDEFEKSVEDKVIAEQEKQAAITRAEAELEVAKLEAQKKIEEARGNAEAQKIIAKAAAEAATYNLIELARTIGYTVNEDYTYTTTIEVKKSTDYTSITTSENVYTAKQPESTEVVVTNEGTEENPIIVTTTTTIALTSTQYTIDITTGPGAEKFKTLVEDYLMYLAYLAEWNGELPDVVAGDDAISIIVPNGN